VAERTFSLYKILRELIDGTSDHEMMLIVVVSFLFLTICIKAINQLISPSVKNLQLKNDIVLVCGKFKKIALVFFEAERLPLRPKLGTNVISAIRESLSNSLYFSCEIFKTKNRTIKLRIGICAFIGKNIDEGLENLLIEANKIIMAFEAFCEGISFKQLKGERLQKFLSEIIEVKDLLNRVKLRKVKGEKNLLMLSGDKSKDICIAILGLKKSSDIKNIFIGEDLSGKIIDILLKTSSSVHMVLVATPKKSKKLFLKRSTSFHGNTSENVDKISENIEEKSNFEWECQLYFLIKDADFKRVRRDIELLKTLIRGLAIQSSIDIRVLSGRRIITSISRVILRMPLKRVAILELEDEDLVKLLTPPSKPFPSISLREFVVNFEIPPKSSLKGDICIGNVLYRNEKLYPIHISSDDLTMHMVVLGHTGFGKTNFVQNLLLELSRKRPDVGWVVIDWKGEYRKLLEIDDKVILLKPLDFSHQLRLNLFDPMGSDPYEHAQKIFVILREVYSALFEAHDTQFSLQMERILREALLRTIVNPNKRTYEALYTELDTIGREWERKIPSVWASIEAIKSRMERLFRPPLRDIFSSSKLSINFKQLLDKKVIIDLSTLRVKGSREDARLLMNILVKYFFDAALKRGIQSKLRHLIIVEEAQYLVPQLLMRRTTIEGTLLEEMVMLERATGQGLIFIATRPIISEQILANTAFKVIFRSQIDSEFLARILNLDDEQRKYLQVMPKYEAIILHPSYPYPFRIAVSSFDEKLRVLANANKTAKTKRRSLIASKEVRSMFENNLKDALTCYEGFIFVTSNGKALMCEDENITLNLKEKLVNMAKKIKIDKILTAESLKSED